MCKGDNMFITSQDSPKSIIYLYFLDISNLDRAPPYLLSKFLSDSRDFLRDNVSKEQVFVFRNGN